MTSADGIILWNGTGCMIQRGDNVTVRHAWHLTLTLSIKGKSASTGLDPPEEQEALLMAEPSLQA